MLEWNRLVIAAYGTTARKKILHVLYDLILTPQGGPT